MVTTYVCYWIYDHIKHVWNTSCGHEYKYDKSITKVKICPFCGRKIETK